MSNPSISFSRVKWSCRRGMLELDLILNNFVDMAYEQLTPVDQHTFQGLLTTADPVLFAWLLGKSQPDDPLYVQMVAKIREHARQSIPTSSF